MHLTKFACFHMALNGLGCFRFLLEQHLPMPERGCQEINPIFSPYARIRNPRMRTEEISVS
jgi:hypothetical protein